MYVEKDKCPICGSNEFITVAGKKICKICGAIVSEEENTIYVSYNEIRKEILFLSPRMKKYLNILNELKDYLNIPLYIIERAKRLIINLLQKYKRKMHPFETISTVLTYVARTQGFLLTYEDLNKFFIRKYGLSLNRNRVIRTIEILKRYKIIESYVHPNYIVATNIYLNRILNELTIYRIDETYYEKMWNIITRLLEELRIYFHGKNPRTVAAISIYLAEMWLSNIENRKTYFTQRKLSQIVGISRFTLRERIRELYSYKGEYLDIIISQVRRRN